jgi:hypothetical protein
LIYLPTITTSLIVSTSNINIKLSSNAEATMAAPTSRFLDKLSPELRLRIYGHVFGSSRVIKPADSNTALGMRKDPTAHIAFSFAPPAPDVPLDVSILLSNRFIFTEALPVLYDEKIIRGTTEDFDKLLQHADFMEQARRIEIADCIGSYQNSQFHSVLRRLQILPKVRSLVILSDCLGHVDKRLAGDNGYLTAPGFCDIAQLGKVTCIDIGRHQLSELFKNFAFVNRRLQLLWPTVRQTPDDYDAYQEFASLLANWPLKELQYHDDPNRIVWSRKIALALQTSLRCWVSMHDLLLAMTMSGEIGNLRSSREPSQVEKFLRLKQFARTTRTHAGFDATRLVDGLAEPAHLTRWCLRGLKASDDHDRLSWATEYLSVNIATHCAPRATGLQLVRRMHRLSTWHEADGSLPTIAYYCKEQDNVSSGLNSSLFIADPVYRGAFNHRENGSYFIGHSDLPLKGIMKMNWRQNFPGLSAPEMKRATHLCMALVPHSRSIAPETHGLRAHDQWFAGLLKRYIGATGFWSQHDLRHASIDDMRGVIVSVLSILASSEERKKYGVSRKAAQLLPDAPAGFDEDLFQALAWRYGWLLERVWRDHVATANATSMDLD